MILHSSRPHEPRRGVILLAVLIVIVILSLAAYTYNDLIMSEYRAADTYARSSQARAAADSGVAYTMGLLCDSNAYQNVLDSNPWNNPAAFQDVIVNDDPNPRKRTKFSIISLCSDPNDPFYYVSAPYRFGVQDESAKLNINVLMTNPGNDTGRINMLMGQSPYGLQYHYYPMNTNIANCLLDWMDPNPTENRNPGAKDSAYMGLPKPYHCKNGPFDTLEELLLVSTVQPQMVFGNDRSHNGTTLPNDNDGNPPNQGWSNFLTVYSREPNLDINNSPRIYINDSNLQTLNTNLMNLQNPGASTLAQFVIAYRLYGGSSITPAATGAAANAGANSTSGTQTAPTTAATMPTPPPAMSAADLTTIQTKIASDLSTMGSSSAKNQITSLTSLITSKVTVTIPGASGRPGDSKSITYYSPMAYSANQEQLLPILYDELTITNAADLTPRININTASQVVLNMFTQLAQSEIVSIQNAQPISENQAGSQQGQNANGAQNPYNTIGWLITVAGIAPSRVQQIEPYITARSRIYRFQSIGYCDSGTPVCRLEVVVDTSGWSMTPGQIPVGRPRIVYRRDISELGSGNFDFLPKPSK